MYYLTFVETNPSPKRWTLILNVPLSYICDTKCQKPLTLNLQKMCNGNLFRFTCKHDSYCAYSTCALAKHKWISSLLYVVQLCSLADPLTNRAFENTHIESSARSSLCSSNLNLNI